MFRIGKRRGVKKKLYGYPVDNCGRETICFMYLSRSCLSSVHNSPQRILSRSTADGSARHNSKRSWPERIDRFRYVNRHSTDRLTGYQRVCCIDCSTIGALTQIGRYTVMKCVIVERFRYKTPVALATQRCAIAPPQHVLHISTRARLVRCRAQHKRLEIVNSSA